MSAWLSQLNEEQRDAITTLDGPLLVIAGAGSGKTRVVTCRIAYLIEQGISPSQILGVTFTNKAADEMQERVRSLVKADVLICTFHRLGARLLRESAAFLGYKSDFTIYDEEDVIKILKTCVPSKQCDVKKLRNLISKAKNALEGPQDLSLVATSPEEKMLPGVYREYMEKMKSYNAFDFDDLLYCTVRLLKENPEVLAYYQERFSHLMVDEYQDTNPTQYEIVRLLTAKSRNLCVVGDPDQSIYSWRGANIQNILNFENDFPGAKVIRLEQNYRSRSNILNAANELIQLNTGRYDKHLWSDWEGGVIKRWTGDQERDEARFIAETALDYHYRYHIPLKEIAVFYRTNAQSRSLEDQFLINRIPHVLVGGISFYQRKEIKDILAFLRMVYSENDYISFLRTINLPKRGIGATTLTKIEKAANDEMYPLLTYCRKLLSDSDTLTHRVRLTANQKQGLKEYLQLINNLSLIEQQCSLKKLIEETIELSGYLKEIQKDSETFEDRRANLGELIAKAAEWEFSEDAPSLGLFLEELSLRTTLDEAKGDDCVQLMTLHNSKGLEFTLVFLAGLEENLLPHANSLNCETALEEERRLCYVGMTRAKEHLFLTRCRFRYIWGNLNFQKPSRFLKEIPENLTFSSR
ncbi:MAG: UvrD-helicase domain-containing protein [Waddliaceae bacterium]